MSGHAAEPWRWRSTDARNITEEVGWVAIPREDYRRLQSGLKGINPDAVQDMLEAAKAFLAPSHSPETYDSARLKLEAAIAKAEGRTP